MTNRISYSFTTLATAGVLLMALAALCGCGNGDEAPATTRATSESAEPSAAILAGTSWQLIEFASMDDATGVEKPEDPARYTMQLDADGTVKFQLNCNRATGTWEAEPAADGVSGSFRFGPLAATKALCPPPSMDGLVIAQAQYVRGYLLEDGNLFLSLMADGGVLAWAPFDRKPIHDPQ